MPISAKWIVIGRSALGLAVYMSLAHAEITLDGSLGPSGPVPGAPNYAITSNLGRQAGSNLFHSFGRSNINTGESATFSGPSTVENILSRVTGGTASTIDGLLRTDFPGASPNLFLMNPSGVMFGPNAELDVQGSFHATTADYIELADGVHFNALPSAADAVLTTAPPEVFGFLDDSSASISFEGSQLQVPEGETLSVVGGDILMQGGTLSAPRGGINLASVASAGRAVLAEDGLQITPLGEGAEVQQGDIKVSQGSLLEVSGSGGAGVFIRGGRFTLEGGSAIRTLAAGGDKGVNIGVKAIDSIFFLDNSLIAANNVGDGNPGKIELEARTIKVENSQVQSYDNFIDDDGHLVLGQGGSAPISISAAGLFSISRGGISTNTLSNGDAGDISIEAGSLELMSGNISSGSFSQFFEGNIIAQGDAGTIDIKVRDSMKMSGFGDAPNPEPDLPRLEPGISTSTTGDGDAGDISIEAGSLELTQVSRIESESSGFFDDSFIFFRPAQGESGAIDISVTADLRMAASSIGSSSRGSGGAGDVDIKARRLTLEAGSGILAPISGSGRGGNLAIEASELSLTDSFLSTQAFQFSSGDAGDMTIRADSMQLDGLTRVITGSAGFGAGGDITIEADHLRLHGAAQISSTAFFSNAGDLSVTAQDIMIEGQGPNVPGLFSRSLGNGDASDLSIFADSLHLKNGAQVAAIALGSGEGGDIAISSNTLTVEGRSQISAQTQSTGDAGSVVIKTQGMSVKDGSQIHSPTFGPGNGGSLTVMADTIDLEGGRSQGPVFTPSGLFVASAPEGGGNAGNLALTADRLRLTGGAHVDATTQGAGDGGNVIVRADDVVVEGAAVSSFGFLPSRVTAGTEGTIRDSGDGGDVIMHTGTLSLKNGGRIEVTSQGPGHGGDLFVAANDVLLEGSGHAVRNGQSRTFGSGLFAETLGQEGGGRGGNVTVRADRLRIEGGATISASTRGSGQGGNINVDAVTVDLVDGSSIRAASAGTGIDAGDSGAISIRANDAVRVFDNSLISVETAGTDAGGIAIQAGNLLHLNTSAITTSAAGGLGSGGNILIDPTFVILDSSRIVANAFEGRGGNIRIVSDFFFASPDSLVDASSELGISGSVVIDSPETDLTRGITALPESFFDATALLRERCGVRAVSGQSSLVIRGGSIPPEPDRYLSASYREGPSSASVHLGIPDKAKRDPARVAEGLELGCGD